MIEAGLSQNWYFTVEGMHCLKCVRKIQALGEQFTQVERLEVNLNENLVSISATETFQPSEFLNKVKEFGFQARIRSAYKKRSHKNFWPLIRLAIAGACAGNIMLMSASNYAGADQTTIGLIFNWLSFALFIPVLIFSAYPLFKNSFLSLIHKKVSVDIPLSLAIAGASLLSFYNLVIGKSDVYFDSLAMFIFFLLSSRYIIYKMQNKYLSPVDLTDFSIQQSVLKQFNNKIQPIKIEDLRTGDTIIIKNQDYIPVDSELLSEAIDVDNSILTGESFPLTLKKHDPVYAGAKLISKQARMRVLKDVTHSRVSQLIDKINQRLTVESQSELLADRGAQYLTLAVLALAFFSFLFFYLNNTPHTLDRILALLVIACPCALAIATPLAHSLTVKRGLESGILFKNVEAIELAHQTDTFIFDKTGTLTEGHFVVEAWPLGHPTEKEKQIIIALEEFSEHPVAKTLKKTLGKVTPIKLDSHEEKPGYGVLGTIGDKKYEVRSSTSNQGKVIEFVENNIVLRTALLKDTPKKEAKKILEDLRSQNKQIYLLTGDSTNAAQEMGKELGFTTEEIKSNVNPEQKVVFIQSLKSKEHKTLFIGDGVNDALAMRESDVSISMYSSSEVTFRTSSLHFMTNDLKNLFDVIQLSKKCVQTIWINLTLSLVYNISFSVLALMGLISPLIAVLIMPLSSLTVVFLTFWRMKGEQTA